MNPFLASLLGQQGIPETLGNPIDVLGQQRLPGEPPNYDDYSLNNVDAVMGRQQDIQQTEEASDRRGLFGMKGTLRDVLGVLGDAFLIQGGSAPMYAPRRRQEQISDAWAGASVDPIAAAERVGYYDAAAGQSLLEGAQTQALKQAQLESLAASREATSADKRTRQIDRGRLQAQAVVRQPGAVNPDGTLTPDAQRVLRLIAQQSNATLEELIGDLQGGALRLYSEAAINPYQQEMLEDRDRQMDQRDYSNQTSRISATRPRAAARPSQPTEAAEIARIRAKRNAGETLSAGDRETWDKYTRPSANGNRRPAAQTERFGPPRVQ